MFQYFTKIVKSGRYIEVYQREKGGFTNTLSANKKKEINQEDDVPRSDFANQRARTNIRRLLNANEEFTKFLTLTFAGENPDLDFAYYEFRKFIQRLKYKKGGNIKYLAVVEWGTAGTNRLHFHLVLDIPYVQKNLLQQIWGNGFVQINKIDHVSNLGAYISKYMGKDTELLKGRKKYFHSRNLNKPKEYIYPWFTQAASNLLGASELLFENQYISRYYGQVFYKQFFEKITCAQDKLVQT